MDPYGGWWMTQWNTIKLNKYYRIQLAQLVKFLIVSGYTKNKLVSWSHDIKLSSRTNVIVQNSLKKKKNTAALFKKKVK